MNCSECNTTYDNYISTFIIFTTIFNTLYLYILNNNINKLKNEVKEELSKTVLPSYSTI